ncbi:hypothetical protein Pelo_2836 [Pelomyxa schiedti]|nr:hypothetical protein Pelo_2836 [Pelomyxa schiedti]
MMTECEASVPGPHVGTERFGYFVDDATLGMLFPADGSRVHTYSSIAAVVRNRSASAIFVTVTSVVSSKLFHSSGSSIAPGERFELAAINEKFLIPSPIKLLANALWMGRDCEVEVVVRGNFHDVTLRLQSGFGGHVMIDTKGIADNPPIVRGTWTHGGVTVQSFSNNGHQLTASINILPPGETLYECQLPYPRELPHHPADGEFTVDEEVT